MWPLGFRLRPVCPRNQKPNGPTTREGLSPGREPHEPPTAEPASLNGSHSGSARFSAHRRPLTAGGRRLRKGRLRVAVGVLADERLQNVQNLFLLAAGHLGNGFKKLTGTPPRGNHALGPWLAQQFLDRDAQRKGSGLSLVCFRLDNIREQWGNGGHATSITN